jgi:hypothetical protein
VDLRVGLDDVVKRKFLPLPGLDSDPLIVQPVASRYPGSSLPSICFRIYQLLTSSYGGHATAQAVSRRLRAQVRSCGICDGQSGTGEVFS